MIVIQGKHNSAVCYCESLEPSAAEQIRAVCDRPEFAASSIRIMPDVHTGKGCTIGTTMTISDKVVPGMVGVDIGCGMETVEIAERHVDFARLDAVIRKSIPAGRQVRPDRHPLNDDIDLGILRCARKLHLERARRSIGTLGGGNHFIEIDATGDGRLFVVVHSGSRHIGTEVAEYYQEEAWRRLSGSSQVFINETIVRLKSEGREREIEDAIRRLKSGNAKKTGMPKDLAYVEGDLFDDYVNDMRIIQRFASLNRQAMVETILREMGLTKIDAFSTIHNYIDAEAMILRKGAVSAGDGEKLLIPINMRDGSLICRGRGNRDWNSSAPHGAGRVMSRAAAFKSLSMDGYKEAMRGIFTTCVGKDTLDESPMAYKSLDSIVGQITPTAEIIERITPLYNFKAGE
ncbi:MAG: RtcB family protein [Planctomycetota bacterium]|jgi:RNA-splicing ligase RtcB|nr:RtcB family protein [Planctomycetota bacterium]